MITEQLSILAIDDDDGDADLLRRALVGISMFQIEFAHVPNSEMARDLLRARSFDLIFVDHMLGSENGVKVIEQFRRSGELLPIIALTGRGDEFVVRELMKKGADDYLTKRELTPDLLRRSIEQARSRFHQRRLESLNKQLANDLRQQNDVLAVKNRRLADLCNTAHEFVDHVSHEFRTPLTVIKEFASIMRDGLAGEPSEEQCEYLGIIINRVEDLCVLVDDMLDTSKLEAGLLGFNRQDLEIGDIIGRLEKPLLQKAAANGSTLEFEIPDNVPAVYCDGEKAGRVITNLIINALKFCGNPGHVKLVVSPNHELSEICISIEDNGRGIPQKDLELLFQRFKQLEEGAKSGYKGFGLGLSIARDLVHLNLGDISAHSELNHGSTFSFTLPFANRRALINRYLRRVGHFRNDIFTLSIIEIRYENELDEEDELAIGRRLSHSIRRSDLLIKNCPGQWLLVAAGNAKEYSPLVNRLKKQFSREHSHLELNTNQEPLIEELGTWDAGFGTKEFMKQFNECVSAMESVHA